MLSICGKDCCEKCSRKESCGGCIKVKGHPFGGQCVAANWVQNFGREGMEERKQALIQEINALSIPDLRITDLNLLNGFYVNLEYPLPNGQTAKFLRDENIYWGNQIERPDSERCYGLVANDDFVLVCEYGCNGTDPQIVLYKKRIIKKDVLFRLSFFRRRKTC